MSPHGPDGASPQRTRLAWRRTALSQCACALLLLHVAVLDRSWPGAAVGVLGLLVWLGAMLVVQKRISAMAVRTPAGVGRALPLTAAFTVSTALLGLVVVALS